MTSIWASEAHKTKEKDDSHARNAPNKEFNKLKNDPSNCNIIFDDFTEQVDDKLRSKTTMIKSQQAEIRKLRNKLLHLNHCNNELEEKLKSSRLAHKDIKVRVQKSVKLK